MQTPPIQSGVKHGDTAPLEHDWPLVSLDEICARSTGTRDPRKSPEQTFRYVDISGVDNRLKIITEARPILGKDAPSRARQVIQANDVLVATTRPNLNAVALVPQDLNNEICSTGFCVLRPWDGIDPEFLFAFVQTETFVRSLSNLVKGALYPAVTDGQVRAQQLRFPPVQEQRRIAARLRRQLAEVAQARAAVQAQLLAANSFPSASLRGVFESQAASLWPKAKLGELADAVQNGVYKPAEQYGRGQPFVRMYNLVDGDWTLRLERLARVDLDNREREAFALHSGDLLISRVNSFELVGKCALVGPDAEGKAFENMLIRLRLKKHVDSRFIAQQMTTAGVRNQIQRVAKRAIGQASINSEDVRSFELSLPPLSDQYRLSAQIEEERAITNELQNQLTARLAALDRLPAALLRGAFNGRV